MFVASGVGVYYYNLKIDGFRQKRKVQSLVTSNLDYGQLGCVWSLLPALQVLVMVAPAPSSELPWHTWLDAPFVQVVVSVFFANTVPVNEGAIASAVVAAIITAARTKVVRFIVAINSRSFR